MRKTLILMAALIGVVMLVASCGTLTTEVTYTFKGDGANPKVGETVRFESSLVFDLEEYDENQEFVCEVKKHKKFYGETYTLKDKHFKKHSKHVKKLKFNKSEGLEDRIEDKLNRTKKTYEWDFDADGITDSTKKKPKHVFTEAGTYWVSVVIVVKNNDKRTKDTYGDPTAFGGVEIIVDPADPDDPPIIDEPYIGTWEWLDGEPSYDMQDVLYEFTFNDSNSFEFEVYGWDGYDNLKTDKLIVFSVEGTLTKDESDSTIFQATITKANVSIAEGGSGELSIDNLDLLTQKYIKNLEFDLTLNQVDDTNLVIGFASPQLIWGRWRTFPRSFIKMP